MIWGHILAGRSTAPAASEAATDIDYDRIGQRLRTSALSPTPAEAHGLLCGLVCAGAPDPGSAWLDQIFAAGEPAPDEPAEETSAEPSAPEARAGLEALARHTLEQIQGPGIGLDLLLPDDSRPLAERATALYDWVRGFLFAFGLLKVSERDLSGQTREIYRDFVELTRRDTDSLDEGEENENALAELIEMVWVAAMLFYEERGAAHRETP